tara:strand:+ start:1901 stop:2596 length:696 start_codon:yes stop_codon:yes gene_type:complete
MSNLVTDLPIDVPIDYSDTTYEHRNIVKIFILKNIFNLKKAIDAHEEIFKTVMDYENLLEANYYYKHYKDNKMVIDKTVERIKPNKGNYQSCDYYTKFKYMVKEAIKSEKKFYKNVREENKDISDWYNNVSKEEFNQWIKKDVKILTESVARKFLINKDKCYIPDDEKTKICDLNDSLVNTDYYDPDTKDIKKQDKNKVVMFLMNNLKETFSYFIKEGKFNDLMWNEQYKN